MVELESFDAVIVYMGVAGSRYRATINPMPESILMDAEFPVS